LLENRASELSGEGNVYDWSVPLAYVLGAFLGLGAGIAFYSEGTRDLGYVYQPSTPAYLGT